MEYLKVKVTSWLPHGWLKQASATTLGYQYYIGLGASPASSTFPAVEVRAPSACHQLRHWMRARDRSIVVTPRFGSIFVEND